MPTIPSLPTVPAALRPFGPLLAPLAVLAITALLLGPAARLEPSLHGLLVYLPYALLLAALALAQYFHRSREFACAALLLCAYWLIRAELQTPLDAPVPQALYALLGIVVPLCLLVQFMVTERGLWTPASLRLVLLGPLLLLAGYLAYGDSPERAARLVAWFPAKPWSGYVLSPGASALFGLSLAAMIALLWLRELRLQPALPGCLLCVYLVLAFFHVPLISTLMFSAAGVMLVIGLLQRSYHMAYRDELTGLLGRRALEERFLALGSCYTLALLDVDHFKRFNDTHGHKAGDDALKMVAAQLERVGGGGIAYRYGGEEFCIVFPRRRLPECTAPLDALRRAIESYPLVLRDDRLRPEDPEEGERRRGEVGAAENVHVTVSIGLAVPERAEDTPESVLREADRALYEAKDAGRNRLAWFVDEESENAAERGRP